MRVRFHRSFGVRIVLGGLNADGKVSAAQQRILRAFGIEWSHKMPEGPEPSQKRLTFDAKEGRRFSATGHFRMQSAFSKDYESWLGDKASRPKIGSACDCGDIGRLAEITSTAANALSRLDRSLEPPG
jgi:hypothetical protein